MSNFLTEFKKRGYIYQATDILRLEEIITKEKIAVYVGFDCTARSLHVGNLMQIMALRIIQKYGHKPIVILGGATSKIGDPTGKNQMRKLMDGEEIARNAIGIKKSLSKFLVFDEKHDNGAILLDNEKWLSSINYLEFLRDFGALFSVNRLCNMETFKSRLETLQHLSFLEFNYVLLQSYDFAYLYRNHGCKVQLGGSDQWGNIVSGVELIKKKYGAEVFGLTTPLLTTSDGRKMGKSLNGAVWLNEEELNSYDYYQFWRNVRDDDLMRFALIYGEFDDEGIKQLDILAKENINEAKKVFAHHLTFVCHGIKAADEALRAANALFEDNSYDTLPVYFIDKESLMKGIALSELLYISGKVSSKSKAKELIKGGACKVNGIKVGDGAVILDNVLVDGVVKISIGKKDHLLCKVK